jgi:hypothetical protein
VAPVLLGILLAAAAPPAAAAGFAADLPAAVADVAGWEVVSGEFVGARLAGRYRFYVNPRRPALYQLMRFRVHMVAPASQAEQEHRASERLVWNAHPGKARPLLAWERTGESWRPLAHGSDEYVRQLGLLMHVLGVHRAAQTGRAAPLGGAR